MHGCLSARKGKTCGAACWQGGSASFFARAESTEGRLSQAYEDAKAKASSAANDIYAYTVGKSQSARRSAADAYFATSDQAQQAYASAVSKAQSQYAKASKSSGTAHDTAQQKYDEAIQAAKGQRGSSYKRAQEVYDSAAESSKSGADSASKALYSSLDSAKDARDKANRKVAPPAAFRRLCVLAGPYIGVRLHACPSQALVRKRCLHAVASPVAST